MELCKTVGREEARAEQSGDAETTLAFNVSVPSDGLQGRSRPEKLLHTWLYSDEAGRRLKNVCGEAWASRRWRSSSLRDSREQALRRVAAAGVSADLLLHRLPVKGRVEPAQSRVRAQEQHGGRDGA